MVDALKNIQIEVPCPVCSDTYSVSAAVVRESQRLLVEGCPGTWTYECPPLYYATLAPAHALDHLAIALDELEEGAVRRGAKGIRVDPSER